MRCSSKHLLAVAIVGCLAFVASTTLAAELKKSPGGDNLLGVSGLARTVAASNHPAGYFAVGTAFEFFTASEFLREGAVLRDHSRLVNTYSLTYTPLPFLEAALALHVISDNTTGGVAGTPDDLQVAVGDPELLLKGSYQVIPGLSLGAMVDVRFPSGEGFFNASLDATTVTLAALGSYRISDAVPLSFHLNVGFVIDGSDSLLDTVPNASQSFAAQLSSFHRVLTRVGIDYATRYVGPFAELSLEPFVGTGNPGFGGSPGRLTLGAKAWLGEDRGLQLLAAAEIGLMGVGPRDAGDLAAGDHAFTIPRWNLLFRVSYRFDPFASKTVVRPEHVDPEATKPKVELPKFAMVSGAVTDGRTSKPVWNAHVRVADNEASALIVDPRSGQYRTFNLPLGKHKIVVSADGYHAKETIVDVTEGGAKADFTLLPKAEIKPGTLRGTVKAASGGKVIRNATLLIPELDQTIQVKPDGGFEISLKPGEYKVVISARGFRTQRKSLRIAEGETVIHNVEMHR